MPSEKPRIQGYLEPELYEHFQRWKAESQIEGDSEALNKLLQQFFNLEPQPIIEEARLREMVQDCVNEWAATWELFLQEALIARIPPKQQFEDTIQVFLEQKLKQPIVEVLELRSKIESFASRLEQLETYQEFKQKKKIAAIGLNQSDLALRLKVNKATLTKNREKPGFTEWTRAKDPQGLGWEYLKSKELFVIVED